MKTQNLITIKTEQEIAVLREAGRILAAIIEGITRSLKSGITTGDLDRRTEELILGARVQPAFKGYRGFPRSSCISVNQEVVHGIPGSRIIQDGDIVSIDVGIIYRNYYADTAVTLGVGEISPQCRQLIKVTRDALYCGIARARTDARLSDISYAIQTFVESHHLSVVREFVGHGIGRTLHEEPEIPNFGEPHRGPLLKPGMVLAIEPMVNLGTWKTRICEDGWTVVTLDGQPSAHFEHTILITEGDPAILTEHL
jgi:methionyl aminopeptidase